MMTRKDYVKTANILKGFADEIHPQVFEDLVEEFAQYFMADNDRFDKARFETACGVDEIGLIPA
jgi:hypothetical protein